MDQVVSNKSLRQLFDEDQKKGGDIERKHFPQALSLKYKISFLKRYKKYLYASLRKEKISKEEFQTKVTRQQSALKARREQYEESVSKLLSETADLINKREFRIELKAIAEPINGKQAYTIGSSLECILAAKHLQKTLKELYEVKQTSRDLIISQVKIITLDDFPKYLIKSDISSFYESVDHKHLLEQLHSSTKLSVLAKRLITRMIKDYTSLSKTSKGLPRGVGISAYLAEIYLQSIDQELRNSSDLVYYSRYVDDMLLAYAPKSENHVAGYLTALKAALKKKGLEVNSKTKGLDFLAQQKGNFEYLGYAFKIDGSNKKILLSQKKLEKYRARIKKSFDDYNKKHKAMPEKSTTELISRISFLTSNTRLFNKKSNAFIGIYFGNKYINDTSQLKGLDLYLNHLIKSIGSEKLKKRLSRLSFEAGFTKKIFRSFDEKTLSAISRGWLHG